MSRYARKKVEEGESFGDLSRCNVMQDLMGERKECGLPATHADANHRYCTAHWRLKSEVEAAKVEINARAKSYLVEREILNPSAPKRDQIVALAAACKRFAKAGAGFCGTEWASKLLQRSEDGDSIPLVAIRFAEEALRNAGDGAELVTQE